MKKTILTLTVIFILIVECKSQVVDTTKYLIDSIKGKESFYIGKQLSVLLQKMKVQPVEYQGVLPNPKRYHDTIYIGYLDFDFYSINKIFERDKINKKSPSLYIELNPKIAIPKVLFYGGKLKGYKWNKTKQNFFGKCVISKIEIRGI